MLTNTTITTATEGGFPYIYHIWDTSEWYYKLHGNGCVTYLQYVTKSAGRDTWW